MCEDALILKLIPWKKMLRTMNQDMSGELLTHQESPNMTFDTTRLHKTCCQEVNSLKIFKILSEMGLCFCICGRIQNLRWTQLESTSESFQSMSRTWGTPSCRALFSHVNTINTPATIRNQCSEKRTRTCWETCCGIRSYQG